MRTETDKLKGTVHRVVFHNPETGYCVLSIDAGKGVAATVVGTLAEVSPGLPITCTGRWVEHPRFGRQFKARSIETQAPGDALAIRRYLGSGAIPEIGPKMADLLVDKFGARTLEVLDKTPEKIRKIKGIGPKRYKALVESWRAQSKARSELMALSRFGISISLAQRILSVYKQQAAERVKNNPYDLVKDIQGIGFKTADEIAGKIGIGKSHPNRLKSGLLHLVSEATQKGDCAVPREKLIRDGRRLLGVGKESLEKALALLVRARDLIEAEIRGEPCCYPRFLYYCERGVVAEIERLRKEDLAWPTDGLDGELLSWQDERGLTLSESQRAAVLTAVREKVVVITGGPGVGKTTVSRAILDLVESKGGRMLLCAPTGRAAKRLSESTERDAQTIHRLLEYKPGAGFQRDRDNPLDTDLVLCDEFSMTDLPLAYALLKAMPDHAALVAVGDKDQLPSVGAGAVLKDLMASGVIPVGRLREIYRQGKGSRITEMAHRIISGLMPDLDADPDSDFQFLRIGAEGDPPGEVAREIQARILRLVAEELPREGGYDPVVDIQVLSPMKAGNAGVQALNQSLQKTLNRSGLSAGYLEYGDTRYAVGDKVAQIRNDYTRMVFNGDVGLIVSVDPENGELEVDFYGARHRYKKADLGNLILAYATTVHRSQGSEYPVVVIPLTTQHTIMLERQMLYTAVTRGKSLVVCVGQEKAMKLAVDTMRIENRITDLARLLSEAAQQDEFV